MRSRLSNKILIGHPHSIIGKTLLLALVFCFVLSGTRSFSTNAADYFKYYIYNRFNQFDVGLDNVEYGETVFDSSAYNFASSLQTSINNVTSWITEYYPSFTWAYSESGNLIECLPTGLYSYLENIDVSDPDFYVNISLVSPNKNFTNSTLLFEFSHKLVQQTVYTSGSIGSLAFSDYLFVHSNNKNCSLSVFANPISVASSFTYSSAGYVSQYGTSVSDQNLVVSISNFLDGKYNNFNFYQLYNTYYDGNFSLLEYIQNNDDSNAYFSNRNVYILPIIIQFSCYALNSDYSVVISNNEPYLVGSSTAALSESPVVLIGGLYSTSSAFSTPTPIPSFEAYPTPTAFPTIAINNNLTPIPEEWDPGIIWEDITTDDVAGNLQGVMTTITDFISSSVPRFYSEVLTIMYRRSDWFSFLAIIPGLSLIIFLLGRLRRK